MFDENVVAPDPSIFEECDEFYKNLLHFFFENSINESESISTFNSHK